METRDKIYREFIQSNQQVLPYFANGFSNHFSMVLWSLKEMGANEEVLTFQSSRERWTSNLKQYNIDFLPLPESQGRISGANWEEHLGKKEYYSDYLAWIRQENILEDELQWEKLLHHLKQKVRAALFHPIIRYSIGYQGENRGEQEIALAYWACSPAPEPGIFPCLSQKHIKQDVEALVQFYGATGDFVGLHYITCFAALIQSPQKMQTILFPHYHGALSLFLQEGGVKRVERSPRLLSAQLYDKAREAAFRCCDDHQIKLTYALKQISEKLEISGLPEAMERALKRSV